MPTVREREKFCSFIQYNQIIAENLVEDSIRQFGNHDVPGFSLWQNKCCPKPWASAGGEI
jgi:hypothetical protein